MLLLHIVSVGRLSWLGEGSGKVIISLSWPKTWAVFLLEGRPWLRRALKAAGWRGVS